MGGSEQGAADAPRGNGASAATPIDCSSLRRVKREGMVLLLSVVEIASRPLPADDRGYTLYLRTGRQRKVPSLFPSPVDLIKYCSVAVNIAREAVLTHTFSTLT